MNATRWAHPFRVPASDAGVGTGMGHRHGAAEVEAILIADELILLTRRQWATEMPVLDSWCKQLMDNLSTWSRGPPCHDIPGPSQQVTQQWPHMKYLSWLARRVDCASN